MPNYLAQLFLNHTNGSLFFAYRYDAVMKRGYMHPQMPHLQLRLNIQAENIEDAASKAYKEWNKDTRVNGKTERSMSVGDVVRLVEHHHGKESPAVYLACDPHEWREIDPEKMIIEGKIDYRVCCAYAEKQICACEICYSCPQHKINRACIGSHD